MKKTDKQIKTAIDELIMRPLSDAQYNIGVLGYRLAESENELLQKENEELSRKLADREREIILLKDEKFSDEKEIESLRKELEEVKEENKQHVERLVSQRFIDLPLGAKFMYVDSDKIWIKISNADTGIIAEYDEKFMCEKWTGQSIASAFDNRADFSNAKVIPIG